MTSRKKSSKSKTKSTGGDDGTSEMRLQRFLAKAGLGSRRKCEDYITDGRISIDNEIVTELGTKVDPERQSVELDGERLRLEPKRYYLLNKPTGYVCTHHDPDGRPRAIDLVPQDGPRLFTVGRLDETSRGLLLVTNDGDLSNRLAHPRFQVERTYELHIAGKPTPETLASLKKGLHFSDGHFRIKTYRRKRTKGNSTFLEIVLTEGRNREIRRLFARVGHKVLKLKRVGFGPLRLGSLKEGRHRTLRQTELDALKALLDESEETKPAKPKRRPRKTTGKKTAGRKSRR